MDGLRSLVGQLLVNELKREAHLRRVLSSLGLNDFLSIAYYQVASQSVICIKLIIGRESVLICAKFIEYTLVAHELEMLHLHDLIHGGESTKEGRVVCGLLQLVG